ncbi:MAG TPA: metallophosphoesterase [Candidatus Margulisiibacteriota bacterium]|nr:metallophosphoesterase [Candidatus Margulisiibacteriota bacterium]
MLHRLRRRLTSLFFANFFSLLVVTISLAQVIMLWWLWPAFAEAGLAGYLLVPVAMYGANRSLMRWTTDCRRRGRRVGPLPRLYFAGAFTCLFCVSYLAVLAGLWAPVRVFLEALAVEARPTHLGPLAVSGMSPVFQWLANVGMAGIAVAFTYGYTIGQRRLRITRLELPLRALPPALDGLRIVQISDIHLGDNLGTDQLERFVGRVNALQPDLICITGDIVDSPYTDVDALLPRLAQLRAAHGVVAILGNHDHYAGAERVHAKLRQLTSFTTLRDACTSISIGGARLHIVGLDDRGRDWARGVRAVAYLAQVLPTLPPEEPVLVLCHRPDIFPQAAAAGVALTLSGHTHGGQLGVPWFNGRVRNLAEFITPFARGLFERNGSFLYVNCGLGVTGQRIRLCTPREITLIEARSRSTAADAA